MLDRTMPPSSQEIRKLEIKKVEKQTIGNLPIYFLKAGKQPIIRLEFIYKAGSWYENKVGLSYLAAKMLSEGTLSFSANHIAEKIASLGAFIEVHHGYDLTNVTFFLLEKHLETLFPLIQEILFMPSFPENELNNLKTITCQNIKVNKEKGQFLSSVELRKSLYGTDHPYGSQYWEEDIEKITREEILAYYKQFFTISNLEVFVSGQFDSENMAAMLSAYLDTAHTCVNSASPKFTLNTAVSQSVLIERPSNLQSSLKMGRHTISRQHADFPSLLVLNELLGGFFGSRLMKNIREDKGFTYGIHSSVIAMLNGAYLVISTDVKKENTNQTVEEVWKEMNRLISETVSEEELSTVRSYMLGKFINSINTPFALMDKFKTIHFGGLDYGYFDRYIEQVKELQADKIQNLASLLFREDEFCQIVVGGI